MYNPKDPRLAERLQSKIQVSDTGCWLWTGRTVIGGYGATSEGRRAWVVHRLVWTKLVGEIGEGLNLHHTCRATNCCNPAHLEPLTRSEHNKTLTRRSGYKRTQIATTMEELTPAQRGIAVKYNLPPQAASRIDIGDNGCLLWRGHLSKQGYGRSMLGGKNQSAHRFIKKCSHGEFGENMHVHHTCKTRHCVNPDHLEVMTQEEHWRMAPSSELQRAKTHCPQGHLYDERNTYKNNSSKHDTRRCKICTQATNKIQYSKRLAERGASPHHLYDIRRVIHGVVSVLCAPFDCRTVAELLGGKYKKMQVLRSLHKLGKQGLIDVVAPRSGRRPAMYKFNPKWTIADPFERNPLAKEKPHLPG